LLRWKRDVIVGILFEIFFVIAFVTSFSVPVGTMANIPAAQPGNYLRLWLIIFALLVLVMMVNAIRKKDATPCEPMFHGQVIFTLILLGAYIYLMKPLGFLVSTIGFTVIIILEYSWAADKFQDAEGSLKKGPALMKAILFYVVMAILISYATEYIFRELLNVALPTWSL